MAWTEYTPRTQVTTQIERGRDTPLSLGMYSGNTLTAPSSGTISVYDPGGVAVVSAAAVAIASSLATYTVSSSGLGSYSYGRGWRVEWSLVMPDTYTHLIVNEAALVRLRYGPQVSDVDLYDLHPELSSYLPSGETTWGRQRDRAHANVAAKLEGKGRPPWLVTSRAVLKPLELYETLSLVCTMLAGTGSDDNKWARLSQHYRELADRTFDSTTFLYENEDGTPLDGGTRRAAARPSIWLCSRAS